MRLYLSNLRNEKGYSQRRVAREAHLSYSHYSRLESGDRGGKVTLVVMGRIANVLNVSLDVLYKYEEAYLEDLYNKQERNRSNRL